MTRLIDCSIDGVINCELSFSWSHQLKISLPYGWKSHVYTQKQIATVTPIDEDKYRSAGGAAAGAIIGGVLTGGIGLLAGAAFGGRRKQRSSYLVTFDDGHHVAFEEAKKDNLKPLNQLVQSAKVKSLILDRDALTTAEGANVIEAPTSVIKIVDEQTAVAQVVLATAEGANAIEAPPSIKMVTDEQAAVAKVVDRPPDQPEKIRTSKGWLIFWGLVALLFGLTFFISLDSGVGVSFLSAFIIVLPLLAVALAFLSVRRIYRWVKKA